MRIMMKPYLICFLLIVFLGIGCDQKSVHSESEPFPNTFCNPINISYRFGLELPSRREAADPTVVWFKDRYYLFASKSGGYWHSQDLVNWDFIMTDQIPTEEYAPTAISIKDTLYFLASSNDKSSIYKSVDPISGNWSVAKETLQTPVWDPAFFLDEDERLYLYWGCSNVNPLYGVELDYKNNFEFIGKPIPLKYPNPSEFGWEVPGDNNTLVNQSPWIEGAWMNKIGDNYYLQYSGPGTEYKSYADGVYVSKNPLGPFTAQAHNPFAYKPSGFATGAGHGSTFSDQYGNYWHIGTITISQKHIFERRLGLYPAFIDREGFFYTNTRLADYPQVMPNEKVEDPDQLFPGWMLLSYNKPIEASSSIDSLPPMYMVDEDIRTYWSATSGVSGQHVILDLLTNKEVFAVQINFAEHQTNIFGHTSQAHQYQVEYSNDKVNWSLLVDKSNNSEDKSHDYLPLSNPINCRFLRVTNFQVPDGYFAISGLRVFGKGNSKTLEPVKNLRVLRNVDDQRSVSLQWESVPDAIGYNVRHGVSPDKLYLNYQVYGDTSLTINSLNANSSYHYSIDVFNEIEYLEGTAIIGD